MQQPRYTEDVTRLTAEVEDAQAHERVLAGDLAEATEYLEELLRAKDRRA